ncbi:MAG: ArnT family glycosyltransferase [Prevotella sp.]
MRRYLLLIVSILTVLPFIGLTLFYSKGEPREAVVALSMLNDGNWILPINNGGDIPYKPPFFHWCIALVSLLQGYVSEFTARFPSALSLIATTLGTYCFYAKRKDAVIAMVAALFVLTNFECHRAGMASRVDMMLACFIVLALFLFYRWWEKGEKGLPYGAIITMTGGVLTKGPIGLILPCLVMWAFFLLRGETLFRTTVRFTLYGIMACIVPALWYIAAYQQGGDAFLALVMEENFGRMMGKMSYDSHVHPFTYNFTSLLAGWLPYTLLILIGLFVTPWKDGVERLKDFFKSSKSTNWLTRILQRAKEADTIELFSWLSFGLIFLFFCIPSSKRSTYLLPCYPFMAYLLARYVYWLASNKQHTLRLFIVIMCVVGIVLTTVFILVRMDLVPLSVSHGKHAVNNQLMLKSLSTNDLNIIEWFLAFIPMIGGVCLLVWMQKKRRFLQTKKLLLALFMPVFTLYFALDGVLLPRLLAPQSDKEIGQYIMYHYPNTPIYSYIESNMMHFFCTNFYANNRIRQFELDQPERGLLLISERELESWMKKHPTYLFKLKAKTQRKCTETKDIILFVEFEKK